MDKQGTEFVIALIPLGGYVKMLDERVEAVAPEMRHYAFNNKTVGQRAAVIAAGPIANFIFRYLCLLAGLYHRRSRRAAGGG
ncbi:zinc metallopeptidase RseP [Klebsiella pneumoniae]|nr:zinc metallopeptidase RseP [Klebsiella pneumoniae]